MVRMGGKTEKSMKGQITFPTLLAFFVSLILFFLLRPTLDLVIATSIAGMDPAAPNYALNVALSYMVTFFVLLALLVSLFNYAVPRQEPYGRY